MFKYILAVLLGVILSLVVVNLKASHEPVFIRVRVEKQKEGMAIVSVSPTPSILVATDEELPPNVKCEVVDESTWTCGSLEVHPFGLAIEPLNEEEEGPTFQARR